MIRSPAVMAHSLSRGAVEFRAQDGQSICQHVSNEGNRPQIIDSMRLLQLTSIVAAHPKVMRGRRVTRQTGRADAVRRILIFKTREFPNIAERRDTNTALVDERERFRPALPILKC